MWSGRTVTRAVLWSTAIILSVPPSFEQGTRVGYLSIPEIGLFRAIREVALVNGQYDLTTLGYNVAHLGGTTWVDDDWGRVVLAGHTPGAFGNLRELHSGDDIYILWDGPTAQYQITGLYMAAVSDTHWLMPTQARTLTLITCAGNNRLVIEAKRIE